MSLKRYQFRAKFLHRKCSQCKKMHSSQGYHSLVMGMDSYGMVWTPSDVSWASFWANATPDHELTKRLMTMGARTFKKLSET